MKPFLFFIICCLALHNGQGAPSTAVYKFVRCNPEGDQANCVTHQSPEMAWSTDLPAKLPASTAQYLEAEPVEEESAPREEDMVEEEETQMMSEEGESPVVTLPEEGSGGFEGSAAEVTPMEDQAFETGSGESWTNKDVELGEDKILRWLITSRPLVGEANPAEHELKEDHLLQL